MLAAWHASMEVGTPIANKDFLVDAFQSLGENRREALKIAAGLRGEDAFNAGVAEEQALETRAAVAVARALRRSWWPSASSSTAGTGWAPRTDALRPQLPRSGRGIGSIAERGIRRACPRPSSRPRRR